MQFKIQGLCCRFDCFVIYNSKGVEMLGFFTCTCTKYHQLLLQDSTAVRVVWENPDPFSVLVSCSVFKIRIASFNYIIICTITKSWLHEPFRNVCLKFRITNGLWFNCCIEKWNVPYCLNWYKVYLFFITLWFNIIMGIHMYTIEMLYG